MRSISRNLFYNLLYQILVVIVPLITSPYLARTLGAEKIGIYSYTYSIVFYFMIFAVLGINNYGNRTIAKVRDDEIKRNRTFCSIYALQLLLSVLVIIIYCIYCINTKRYTLISWIQGFYIVSNLLDITWYFYGMENFKLTVFRNAVIKLLSLIAILCFVKTENDIYIYTLIMAGSTALGQLIVWPTLLKEVSFNIPTFNEISIHLKPVIILFIPVLAISVFSYMDKMMLGNIAGMKETGYYENAEKIISIPKALIQAVGTVMLPRTANLLAKNKEDLVQRYIRITMLWVMFISVACAFGLAGVSSVFAPVFWGSSFTRSGEIIMFLTPALIFSVFGNVIRTQYLIPNELDKSYTISLVLGAVVNLFINALLIPVLGAVGAAIGTIVAEFSLCFYQAYAVRKNINIGLYINNAIPFGIIGFVMFIIIREMGILMNHSILTLLLQIVVGATVYIFCCFILFKTTKNDDVRDMGQMLLSKISAFVHI